MAHAVKLKPRYLQKSVNPEKENLDFFDLVFPFEEHRDNVEVNNFFSVINKTSVKSLISMSHILWDMNFIILLLNNDDA